MNAIIETKEVRLVAEKVALEKDIVSNQVALRNAFELRNKAQLEIDKLEQERNRLDAEMQKLIGNRDGQIYTTKGWQYNFGANLTK